MTTPSLSRVLIVDDEPNVLATLQPILARDGHVVETAQTGADARAAIGVREYDVVITDLRLADADGLDIVESVRKTNPVTPVIVLTGFGSLDSAVMALQRGVYDYLLKPCDVDELRATVRRAVDHGNAVRARERLPEEVRDLMASLDVTKRELELSLSRERAVSAQLRERDELRNQFIANVSHELKTPLTAIYGYVELMIRRGKSEGREDLRQLEAVLRAARELRRLVDELLAMVSVESGQVRIEARPTDVREAIDAAVSLSAPLAVEKGVDLRADLPTLPFVNADPAKLGQVFNNLLSNALKFTPAGGRVTVDASPGEGVVHVRVHDTGVGIPPDDLARVFARFYRSEAAAVGPGLGLGLYITRAIVESHSGAIWIESEVGKGTTVHFTIPALSIPATV